MQLALAYSTADGGGAQPYQELAQPPPPEVGGEGGGGDGGDVPHLSPQSLQSVPRTTQSVYWDPGPPSSQ